MGCGRAGGGSGAHRPGAQGRLTLTEGQNLELNAHVDGADLDSRGYGKESGGKTENEADPRRNEPITDRLGGCIRCGNDTDLSATREDFQVGEGTDGDECISACNSATDDVRIDINEPDNAEASARKTAVGGQCMAKVPHADNDNIQRLPHAQPVGNAAMQEVHVVAHPAGAVGAEVRQVFAEFGACDSATCGQVDGRHGGDAGVTQVIQDVEIRGQALNSGGGNLSTCARRRYVKGHGGTYLKGRRECSDPRVGTCERSVQTSTDVDIRLSD